MHDKLNTWVGRNRVRGQLVVSDRPKLGLERVQRYVGDLTAVLSLPVGVSAPGAPAGHQSGRRHGRGGGGGALQGDHRHVHLLCETEERGATPNSRPPVPGVTPVVQPGQAPFSSPVHPAAGSRVAAVAVEILLARLSRWTHVQLGMMVATEAPP